MSTPLESTLDAFRRHVRLNDNFPTALTTATDVSAEILRRLQSRDDAEKKVYQTAYKVIQQKFASCNACKDLLRRILALCLLSAGYDEITMDMILRSLAKQHRLKPNVPLFAMTATEIKRIYLSLGIEWTPCIRDSVDYVSAADVERNRIKQEIATRIARLEQARRSGESQRYIDNLVVELEREYGVRLTMSDAVEPTSKAEDLRNGSASPTDVVGGSQRTAVRTQSAPKRTAKSAKRSEVNTTTKTERN